MKSIKANIDLSHSFSTDSEFEEFIIRNSSLIKRETIESSSQSERSVEIIAAIIGASSQIIAAFISAYFAFKKEKQEKVGLYKTKIIITDKDKVLLVIDENNIEYLTSTGKEEVLELVTKSENLKIQ
jgi:hypothetical protein